MIIEQNGFRMVTLYSLQILLEYLMVLQHRLLKMPQFFPGWREGIRSRVSEMSYSALWAYAVDAAWMWLSENVLMALPMVLFLGQEFK